MKERLSKYYHSERVYFFEWVLAALTIAVVMFSYIYVDTRSLTIWSTNVWDVLFDGKPLEFWSYTSKNVHHVPHGIMANDLISVLPLSVWNLPIWIVQRFFGYDINKNWILMSWSKLGFVVALIATAYVGYKLCLLITEDKNKSRWAAILIFGSAMCVNGVAFAGQNDIFFIFFGVLSVYLFIKGRLGWFIAVSAISVAIKPFFIFVFVPMVMLREKNIIKIGIQSIGAVSLLVANRIIFSSFPGYTEAISSGPSQRVLVNMFKVGFLKPKVPYSLFLIAWILICYVVYTMCVRNEKELNSFAIYIPAAVYTLQCSISDVEHYRMLMCVPFLVIVVLMNTERLRLNLALYTIFQIASTALNAIHSRYFFAPKYIKNTLLSYFIGNQSSLKYRDLPSYLFAKEDSAFNYLKYIVAAVFMISAIILLFINYPRNTHRSDMEKTGVFAKYDHGLLVLNLIIMLPLVLFSVMLYLK